MIRSERVIQLNIAFLILVGSLLLSIAQQDSRVLIITAAGVTFSLLVVDWFRWLSFHPAIVNMFAFAVSFYSFLLFLGGSTGTKLNAVASLLTYLQLVLLLQKKSPRLYWQVMMLSLLQVVVAAALNLDFGAGLVFFGYIILVVIGTIHLKIYRTNYRLAEYEKRNDSRLVELENNRQGTSIGVLNFRASRIDGRNESKIAWQGFLLCFCSLFFSFSVFYSVPRFGSAWYGPGGTQNSRTGFAREIRFEDTGFLEESNRNVLRASFIDESNHSIQLAVAPYFKGMILTDYTQDKNGVWVWSNAWNSKTGRLGQGADYLKPPISKKLTYIRQVVRLEPSARIQLRKDEETHLLFAVNPAFQSLQTPSDLLFNPFNEMLFRDASLISRPENSPYHYETLTPLYRNLGQIPAIPISEFFVRGELNSQRLTRYLSRLRGEFDERFLSDWKPIAGITDIIVSKLGTEKSRRVLCNELVNHLKGSEFNYTRDLRNIKKDPRVDPIVDFLVNHKSGFCEYYATALALMLRSQDIPCRLVTGFRGGDYNSLGGFYSVKEKHAHVWVEVYLRPQDCDAEMINTGQASLMGAWLRLDPTPASQSDSSALDRGLLDRAFDAVGFAQKIWDDYVTGLDEDSRTFNGFDPTSKNDDFAGGILGYFRTQMDQSLAYVKQISSTQWMLFVSLILIVAGAILNLRVRAKFRAIGKNATASEVVKEMLWTPMSLLTRFKSSLLSADPQTGPTIKFYNDFIQLMNSQGFEKQTSETPQEFGDRVSSELNERLANENTAIGDTIRTVIQLFYASRFGAKPKSKHDEEKARQSLNRLEQILKNA